MLLRIDRNDPSGERHGTTGGRTIMASHNWTVSVGTHPACVDVALTDAAVDALETLPSARSDGSLRDHRPLLTSIAISRAASGQLVGDMLELDATDIANERGEPDLSDVAASPYQR